MTTSDWISFFGIATGLVTTIGSTIVLAFKMGSLHNEVRAIARDVDDIKSRRLPWIEFTIASILAKLNVLWTEHLARSNSPIALNEAGLRALEASNIGEFAKQHYSEILSRVKEAKPLNAYQAQQELIVAVASYGNIEPYKLKLQNAAFASGQDVNSLLFIAALSIRDRVVSDLGFSGEISF
ncbi:MAG TPA: hypothetical protein VFE50_13875 [Cyclobacteriaceae bacterium]|nr:hypothetical protein [Cyclobacteriaceae bacterium]